MKKLVTAFALCASISAMAAVTSENVVGYQTVTCASGFTVFSPTFLTVGGTPFTYKDISGTMEWGDNLQFFNAGGAVTFTASWATMDMDGVPDGWYDGSMNSLANTEIPAGQGFFVSLATAGSITVKGEVNRSSVTVTSVEGFKVMGNCMPAGVKYGDLVCTGIAWGDNLQFFNAGGAVIFTASWATMDMDGVPDGWYDGSMNSLANTVIPAGQGFFLSTASAGATIQIPAPTI